MDKKYIECEALLRNLADDLPYKGSVKRVLMQAPAADVVEVRHGEWVIKSVSYRMLDDFDEELYVECPFCKRRFWVAYELDDEKILKHAREKYPYCHCGAKMDGGKE